jgi:DNA-binding NarL/FixJ family response regulator
LKIRVVLADDQAMIRAGFRLILEAEPDIEVVGEAEDGAQAISVVQKLKTDVVLMDIQMPVDLPPKTGPSIMRIFRGGKIMAKGAGHEHRDDFPTMRRITIPSYLE